VTRPFLLRGEGRCLLEKFRVDVSDVPNLVGAANAVSADGVESSGVVRPDDFHHVFVNELRSRGYLLHLAGDRIPHLATKLELENSLGELLVGLLALATVGGEQFTVGCFVFAEAVFENMLEDLLRGPRDGRLVLADVVEPLVDGHGSAQGLAHGLDGGEEPPVPHGDLKPTDLRLGGDELREDPADLVVQQDVRGKLSKIRTPDDVRGAESVPLERAGEPGARGLALEQPREKPASDLV